jgi:hypothetical protein
MIKFIKKLFLFLVPIIALSYVLDIFISSNLKKSNKYAEKEFSTWNDIISGKVNSDILIYGSSRAWTQISPKIISDRLHSSAYNLGIDGHNFNLQYLRHKMLLKNNSKPKLIIISVDYFTLQKRIDLYNSEQFLPYLLSNKQLELATNTYKGFNYFDYHLPLVRYYGKYDAVVTALRYSLGHLSNPIYRVNGYQGREESWNNDFDKAKLTMSKYKIILDTSTVVLFKKFLTECKRDDIKVIFVYTPEYIEGQKFVANREYVFKVFSMLSKNFQIPFYDFSNDAICCNKDFFYNSNHLNKTGAELFTRKFVDTLLQSNVLKDLKKK